MNRFLLYDDKCERCGSIAHTVERVGNGWLTIRGLSEPDVRRMLDSTRPNWKWRPMLVVSNKDKVRVYTGLMMILRLGCGLGPFRAFRILTSSA